MGRAANGAPLERSSAFDFDDLLRYAVIALESDDRLRAAVGRRFGHVRVDEFQDLNPAQSGSWP